MKTHNCSNCGASLTFEDNNRDFAFCHYCGAKIILDDYRSTHRVVDEARIKEAEINAQIRLKELEMEENRRKSAEKAKTIKIKISIILGTIGVLMIIFSNIFERITNDSFDSFNLTAIGMILIFSIAFIWLSDDKKT